MTLWVTNGPMGALVLVDKTSRLLTWTYTLCLVSSGLPGPTGPSHGIDVTYSVGRHCAGTTEHTSSPIERAFEASKKHTTKHHHLEIGGMGIIAS